MNQSKPDLDFVVCQYCSVHHNSSRLLTPLLKSTPMPPPPLRPFPIPSLSIGTDIAHIPRIAKLVASQRTLPRFLRKLFTSREERAFHLRFPLGSPDSDSGSSSGGGKQQRREDAAARFLAGRWAAKEAVVKACSWRRLMFDEIQILKDEGGKRVYGVILDRPEVRSAMRGEDWGRKQSEALTGEGGEDEDIPGQIVRISISHDGEYATAVCLAAEETNETL
jgi:holo-[acyl-carrier protein] synthase